MAMTDTATPHEALAAMADKIFDTAGGARPIRLALRIEQVPLDVLRDRIKAFGAVDGWLAFASRVATIVDHGLDRDPGFALFADSGAIADGPGPILAAELVCKAGRGMTISHLGGGEARLVTMTELAEGEVIEGGTGDADTGDCRTKVIEVIARPHQVLGTGVAAIDYMEYWLVPDDGAARPVAARLVGMIPMTNDGDQ